MTKTVRFVFCTLLLAGMLGHSANLLDMTVALTGARYCRGPDGEISLNFRVNFVYRNAGNVPVVLPLFTRVSGYELFRDEADLKSHHPMTQISLRLPEMFDALKLDPSKPIPQLFERIPPGGTASRIEDASVKVFVPGKDHWSILGTSPLIQFTVDNWPGHQHIQETQRVWGPLGTLHSSQDTSPPVRLIIDKNPATAVCYPRVD